MHYHPVVDQVIRANPLDPIAAITYVAIFAAVALLAARRPAHGLAAFVVLIPFALYRDIFGTTITLPKVALLGIIVGLTAYRGVPELLRARPAARLLILGGLVCAGMALSVLQATYVHPALRETLKALEYLLVFAAAYACFRLDRDAAVLQWAIVIVTALVALLALAQEVLGAPSGMYFNNVVIPRIAGPLEGPNQLAGYLEISIAMLGSFLCARPSKLVACTLGLAAFADVLTFSRAGLLAAVIAVVVIVIVYRRRALALIAPLASGIALGAIAVGIWSESVRVTGGSTGGGVDLFNRHTLTGTSYAGGVGSRGELWRAAFTMLRKRWALGVGAGNYELLLPTVGLKNIRTHSNSLYIQAWVEGGVPLLLATLGLVYASIATFVRGARSSPFIAGALAASVALALHQIVDYLVFYNKVGEWWWVVLALGAAELTTRKK